jgi:hypothetical protein
MADTWGSAPHSIFRDESLDGATMEERAFFVVLKVMSNDVGLFEGDAGAFAHLIHGERDDVERLMTALETRGLVRRYRAAGRVRLVGQIIHSYEGECLRKANPSQRTQSFLPWEDGTFFAGRAKAEGKQPDAAAQPSRNLRATSAQPPRKSGASPAQPPRNERATSAQHRREEKREEQSSSLCSERSLHTADVDSVSAPSQPAPWGGGLGAEAPAPALDPERFRAPPYVPRPGERPLMPAQITEDHPDPAGLAFVPTEKQQACTAMKWGSDYTPEHSAALLAWAKESGVPETRLKRWLVMREGYRPWPEDWPLSKCKRRSKAPEEIYP